MYSASGGTPAGPATTGSRRASTGSHLRRDLDRQRGGGGGSGLTPSSSPASSRRVGSSPGPTSSAAEGEEGQRQGAQQRRSSRRSRSRSSGGGAGRDLEGGGDVSDGGMSNSGRVVSLLPGGSSPGTIAGGSRASRRNSTRRLGDNGTGIGGGGGGGRGAGDGTTVMATQEQRRAQQRRRERERAREGGGSGVGLKKAGGNEGLSEQEKESKVWQTDCVLRVSCAFVDMQRRPRASRRARVGCVCVSSLASPALIG